MRPFEIYHYFVLIQITLIGNQTCQSFTRWHYDIILNPYHRSSIFLKYDTNLSLKSKVDEQDTKDESQHILTQSQKDRIARIKRGPSAYGYHNNYKPPSQKENTIENVMEQVKGGVPCTGEPSIDPSRSLQNNAGYDSEWMEDFYFDAK